MEQEIWLARDENGSLWLYGYKPQKYNGIWLYRFTEPVLPIDNSLFPEVKWSDEEPTKVKLVIDK